MMKYWIPIGVLIATVLVGGTYFSYKEISLKNNLDSQQKAISELQAYRDEQVKLTQEKIQLEEENKRLVEQNQVEQQEKNTKRDCEDTKRYCSDEIINKKASIDYFKNQIKNLKVTVEAEEKNCGDTKADDEESENSKQLACLKSLAYSALKETKQNLIEQENELDNLLKGKCLNYQAPCE